MSLGKSLRAAARHGLRCYQGDWGELLDDPFAARAKKAQAAACFFDLPMVSGLGLVPKWMWPCRCRLSSSRTCFPA